MFIGQPLREIEYRAEQCNSAKQVILTTYPLKIMVDMLGIDPNDQMPYIIDGHALPNIILGFRTEVNKLLEKVKSLKN